MSAIDDIYEFRLANAGDIDEIMGFIAAEWKPDHILAIDRDFFCYQHQIGDKVNFMIAINKETGQIDGLEGFIQYSKELTDVGAVMWCVSKKAKTPFLGVRVVNEMKAQTKCRLYGGPGTNPRTAKPLHEKILKHHVGEMRHYYRLSMSIDSFRIAVIKNKIVQPNVSRSAIHSLKEIKSFEDIGAKFNFENYRWRKPFKDAWYFERRYFKHPIYQYRAWGVIDQEGRTASLLVAREVAQNGAKILRIVDYIGELESVGGIGAEVERLTGEGCYEYVDLYCAGVDGKLLEQAGFIRKDERDGSIIPNYFEPFVQDNIAVHYASNHADAVFFKGDADQDRPNYRNLRLLSEL